MGVGGVIVVALAVVFALTFLAGAPRRPRPAHPPRPTAASPRSAGADGLWHRTADARHAPAAAFLVPTLAVAPRHGRSRSCTFAWPRRTFACCPPTSRRAAATSCCASTSPTRRRTASPSPCSFPRRDTRSLTPERAASRLQTLVTKRIADPAARYASVRSPFTDAADRSPMAETRSLAIYATRAIRAPRATRRAPSWRHPCRPARGDGTLVVGGETASDIDATAYVLARAPRRSPSWSA